MTEQEVKDREEEMNKWWAGLSKSKSIDMHNLKY